MRVFDIHERPLPKGGLAVNLSPMMTEQQTTDTVASVNPVTACLLIIGNEILSGRTQDANLAYLARGLNEIGIQLREVRVIPDVNATIIETLNAVRANFNYVLTTGGIGPTHDDITAQCVADAFGVPLQLHDEAKRRLEERYVAMGHTLPLNAARLRMAHIPQGARLIDNPVSAAPGFLIGNVAVMAGVPQIAQAMFQSLKPFLAGGLPVQSVSITCALAEGTMAAELGAIQADFPDVDIGSYPFWQQGGPATNLVLRGTDPTRLETGAERIVSMIRGFGVEPSR